MPAAVDLVTSYLDSLGGDDADAIAAHVGPDFHNEHLSALGTASTGRDEYQRRLPDFLAAFAERGYTIDDVVEREDGGRTDVVVRYRFRARHDGHPITIPGVMWFSVGDGSIRSRIDVWDSLTFLRQTGEA